MKKFCFLLVLLFSSLILSPASSYEVPKTPFISGKLTAKVLAMTAVEKMAIEGGKIKDLFFIKSRVVKSVILEIVNCNINENTEKKYPHLLAYLNSNAKELPAEIWEDTEVRRNMMKYRKSNGEVKDGFIITVEANFWVVENPINPNETPSVIIFLKDMSVKPAK
ncbi:MAG: hypothetical protein HQM10_08890 [Candidatus Riflebacteria bacterium]|nr:hypothetical protein [Candidatus Riflebacteria bacterium]